MLYLFWQMLFACVMFFFIWRLWFKADVMPIIAMADVVAMWQMVKSLGWIYFNLSSGMLIRPSSYM